MYKILEIAKRFKTTRNSSNEASEQSIVAVARTSNCKVAKDTCGPCREGESLDRNIHRMEEAFATLKALRASNNTKINTVHDPLSRLPIELVSNIFMYLRPLQMEANYQRDVKKPDDVAKSMKAPLLLGAVCRAWRAFAWSIPSLWTSISVNVYNENDSALDMTRQWLARSGRLPLYIYLYTARRRLDDGLLSPHAYGNEPYVERLMNVVNAYSGRWFYLNLDIPKRFMLRVHCSGSEAPMLETVKLHIHLDDDIEDADIHYVREKIKLGKTRNLKTIYISSSLTFHDIAMDWASVNHAEGSYLTLETSRYLFRAAPILARLTLERIIVDRYELPSSIVRHQNLLSLQINSSCSEAAPDALLLYLDLPALEDLGFFANHKSQLDSVHGFLRRSSCNLKKFKLNITDNWMENQRGLISLLDKMPYLETLKLECEFRYAIDSLAQYPTPIMIQEMESINERLFLPNLKTVHVKLQCPLESFSLDLLLRPDVPNTIRSLGQPSHNHFASCDMLDFKPLFIYHLLDMEAQGLLRPIIESGFKIDICSKDLHPVLIFLYHTLYCYTYNGNIRSFI